MLKFLQNREEDKSPRRSPIKFLPEMCYGNSFQSPQQFQTKKTIFYRRSYVSPYLKFQKQRNEKIPVQFGDRIQPEWTKKSNLTHIQQHKILQKEDYQAVHPNKSRYLSSYNKEYAGNPHRFRLTRGQLTDFIEKNNHYKSIGPLQGVERTQKRIEQTKKSVWLKPISKKQEMTSSLRYASSCNTTIKSSISKNSQLLTQKIRIRRNRQRIQKLFKKQLQNRKKDVKNYHFEMSKEGPQHELYLLQPINRREHRLKTNDGIEDLQKFEENILRRFK